MEPEYRSSYISYPMLDRTTKILPREMFRIHSPPKPVVAKPSIDIEPPASTSEEAEVLQKVTEDKQQREKAVKEQHECHLQKRAVTDENHYNVSPTEYKRQYVAMPMEKANSIPQMTHIRMHGDFHAVPEYAREFRMYSSYAKPEAIRKSDNLRISGSEGLGTLEDKLMPEYRDKFNQPPKNIEKEKPLKTDDHLHPKGEFSKDVPEYYESFRDPQIKEMPERGKCREPYLHLRGKLEFNPEYRNTYLDFPRSRPIVPKPTSTFRLPTSNASSRDYRKTPSKSPIRYRDTGGGIAAAAEQPDTNSSASLQIQHGPDISNTPEYRKACYQYQIRERSPTRSALKEDLSKTSKMQRKKSISPSAANFKNSSSTITAPQRNSRRTAAAIQSFGLDSQSSSSLAAGHASSKGAKFGRRANGSVLRNASNCRQKTSIIEGNPKYTLSQHKDAFNSENIHDSFVVLDSKPSKRSHWMH